MFAGVLSPTYHSPITIEFLTYRVLLGTLTGLCRLPQRTASKSSNLNILSWSGVGRAVETEGREPQPFTDCERYRCFPLPARHQVWRSITFHPRRRWLRSVVHDHR